ncbi:MAG: hypothetical protein ACLFPQ_03220 [Candidatus Woesearchaeota archaeon]
MSLEICDYLGHGNCGIVFKARYYHDDSSQDVALKLIYGTESPDFLEKIAKKEYENLSSISSIKDIKGVPRPIGFIQGFKGKLENLYLEKTGLDLSDIKEKEGHSLNYGGAFMRQYLPDIKQYDYEKGSMSARFFDELEEIIYKVHSAGYVMPQDFTHNVLILGKSPCIVDWEDVENVSKNPIDYIMKRQKIDFELLNHMKQRSDANSGKL